MISGERVSLLQFGDWPNWRLDGAALAGPLAAVHRAQGNLAGRMAEFGDPQRAEASARTFTDDVLKTSEIDGEHVNAEFFRSSIARRLGVDAGALAPVDRRVEGVVEMVLDATQNFEEPLTPERCRNA